MALRIGSRTRIVLTWLSTLAPAALIAVLVAGNAVDTLYMDDWDLVGTTLIEARSGRLGLSQLVAQHNESRPLVPRLLFLAIGSAARGDTRWLLLLSFTLACLVSYSVFRLARATLTASLPQIAGLTFVANLLIFTPKQAEIWLWCSYVGLEPIACLAASLALLQTSLGSWKKFAGSAVLCTAATFSYANGLSTWLLVAPVLALAVGRRWLIGWMAGFLASAVLYFHGYVQPSGLPLSAAPLSDGFAPLLLGHYVLAFLGASLGVNRPLLATTVGAILSALFVLASLYGLRHAHDESLRRRLLPWLSIGAYSILSALAAAVGRSRFGAEHAMANRYIPFSLYLGLALVFAVPIVLQHARADGWARGRWRLARLAVSAGLVIGLGLHGASAVVGAGELIREGRMLRYGRSCLLFILVRPDERCLVDWVYPDPQSVLSRARELDRLGYLHPGLIETSRLQDILPPGLSEPTAGFFELFLKRGVHYVAKGWAARPLARRPADAVVLAGQKSNGDWEPLGFAPVLAPRPDIARARGAAYRDSGWRGELAIADLHPGVKVSAWALDVRTGRAAPLAGVFTEETAGR